MPGAPRHTQRRIGGERASPSPLRTSLPTASNPNQVTSAQQPGAVHLEKPDPHARGHRPTFPNVTDNLGEEHMHDFVGVGGVFEQGADGRVGQATAKTAENLGGGRTHVYVWVRGGKLEQGVDGIVGKVTKLE